MASSTHLTTLKPIDLIVYSDFNCPWCYVAHKEISTAVVRARAAHPDVPFKLEYRPFQLDPSLPEDKPMCRIACYKKKFGSEARMGSVCQLLKERGTSVGINFHFKGLVRQTTNAHRLVLKSYLMGGEQMQHKMLNQLFAAYFEEERDIGCFDSLSNAAVNAGVFTTHPEVR
jgi:predicted DsbA family dithiol-disulfide isomerase